MKIERSTNISTEVGIYVADFTIGPLISALLDRFVITNPSEYFIAFIYLLGFSLSAFRMWQSVRTRKLRFLEKMVYRKKKKNGEETEEGRIDENSVKMAEALTKL